SVKNLRGDRLCDRGILFEIRTQLVVDQVLDQTADLARAELRLRLTLELGLRQLDGDDRRKSLSHVIPGHRLRLPFAVLGLGGEIAVEATRERRAEPDQMGTAFDGVD